MEDAAGADNCRGIPSYQLTADSGFDKSRLVALPDIFRTITHLMLIVVCHDHVKNV
jgi:hypothetical protein